MPAPLRMGEVVLWIHSAAVREELEIPEWLLDAAAPGSVMTRSVLDVSVGNPYVWVVADACPDPVVALNELADLGGQIQSDGWLWIRLFPAANDDRGGRPRWRWLVDLGMRQGFECRGQQVIQDVAYLVFRKTGKQNQRWILRSPAGEGDHAGCRSLFLRAFDQVISPELWEWKYGSGRGRATMAMRGERVIAHYGCVSRRILMRGQEIRALQICDVMVDPAERAIMTRTGAFFQVARSAQEAFIGFGADHELGYGFPNQRHMRLAETMGLYDEVERLVELEWPTAGRRHRLWTTKAELSDGREMDRRSLAGVWERMRHRMMDQILVVRDADYWQYRYTENPKYDYAMLSVRRCLSNQLIGIVVLRREAEECKLIDVLAEPRHMKLLVSHARRQAAEWGVPVLKAWLTQHCAHWLAGRDAVYRSTDIVIPLNIHARVHLTEEVRGRWFLMMGDTDFL